MSLFFADLVREFSSSTGAGDFVLDGALPGHRRFAGAVPAGARFHYAIAGVTKPAEWETGEGEIGSGGALVRSPLASSAGGGLVSFSAGLKTVALTVGAAWFAEQDSAVNVDLGALQAELAGKAEPDHDHDGAYASVGHGHGFASLSDRPTTLAGYGISDAAAARAELGLGSLATQNGNAVAITGGTVSGLASLAVAGGIEAVGGIGTNAPSPSGNTRIEVPGDTGTPGYIGFYRNGTTRVGYIGYQAGTRLTLTTEAGFVGWAVNGDISMAGPLSIGGIQVAGARRTGWTAPSGTAARGGFDTASVTTAQLAERVKALVDDLIAHGLIGS